MAQGLLRSLYIFVAAVKTSRTAGYQEKMFRALNAKYFDGAIEQGWTDIAMTRIEWSSVPRGAGSGNAAGGATAKPTVGANARHRKYACPCCGNSVRATKEVHILCIDCGEVMQRVKKSGRQKPPHDYF